ncbi:uncharacterized protein N7525_000224 [Penicillium rubens]|jgi:hypothetical protein|uniref:uncharacterized protein n=1 Tax=Penicillium rubens TaxID=1108849 RepID=UPI002A5A781B|nr:uncharacterized protein N7525_000224 [Penicillium rubens]KAJ5842483.1 hypothetical protein N7525_000224 [Penicillium rubens]KAJ5846945.1 hypothetical protein N7534_010614 [Penicillium rubens]
MGKVNNANLKILTQPLCVAAQFKRLEPQSGLGADEKKKFRTEWSAMAGHNQGNGWVFQAQR